MPIPRIPDTTSTYFVRCELRDADGSLLAQNAYWSSTTDDDLGDPRNEMQFKTDLPKWADLSPLNTMPRAAVKASATFTEAKGQSTATITLTNPTNRVAFLLCGWLANRRFGHLLYFGDHSRVSGRGKSKELSMRPFRT